MTLWTDIALSYQSTRGQIALVGLVMGWGCEERPVQDTLVAMIETKKVPKNLYDLARALSRWEGEGGAEEPLQGSEVGQVSRRRKRKNDCAVSWCCSNSSVERSPHRNSTEPVDDAASMSNPERRFRLKQQIASFLHDHKDDSN